MQTFIAGQANTVEVDIVAKASGDPITSGTVNFYLVAKNGTNAGKYFRASDSSWQVAESSAGAAVFVDGSSWALVIAEEAWLPGVEYRLYAKESGNLNIVYNQYYTESLLGTIIDGSATIEDVMQCLLAFIGGKVTVVDNGTTVTITYYRQDGTTAKLQVVASNTNGARASSGTIDP